MAEVDWRKALYVIDREIEQFYELPLKI